MLHVAFLVDDLLASQDDSFESGEALLAKWSYIETNKHVYKEAGQRGRRP